MFQSYVGGRPHGGGPSIRPGRNHSDVDARNASEQPEARRQEGRAAVRDVATKATFDAARRDFWTASVIWLAFGLSFLLSR